MNASPAPVVSTSSSGGIFSAVPRNSLPLSVPIPLAFSLAVSCEKICVEKFGLSSIQLISYFRRWNVWLPMKRMLEVLRSSLIFASETPPNSQCLSLWILMFLLKLGTQWKDDEKKRKAYSEWHDVSGLLPVESLWIIKHPSSPKVTITNFSFGNLNIMDPSAHGMEDASVHACATWETENFQPQNLRRDVGKEKKTKITET